MGTSEGVMMTEYEFDMFVAFARCMLLLGVLIGIGLSTSAKMIMDVVGPIIDKYKEKQRGFK
jgi:uncharacterized metal-binding protein